MVDSFPLNGASVTVVCNPSSGRGRSVAVCDAVTAELTAQGVEHTVNIGSSREETADALASGAARGDRLLLVGGDGLVHLAANAAAGTNASLGIIPAGSGNDFAGALGLPDDLRDQLRTALGPAQSLDLLRVDPVGIMVATVATFGFSAVVNRRAESMRFPRGSSRYTVATLREAARLTRHQVTLDIDGERHEAPITLAAVANTGWFGGGMRIAPDADATDGLADLVVVGAVGRITLLRVLPKAFSGAHVHHAAVEVTGVSRLEVSAAAPLELRGDGEAITVAPFSISTVPGALRVATNAAS